LLTFYLLLRPSSSASLAILLGIILLLVYVITGIVDLELVSLKGLLILSATFFAADSQLGLLSTSLGNGGLLWLQWQAFGIGLTLSHEVRLHGNPQPLKPDEEETMPLKLLFSLIGMMAIYLVAVGKRLLKAKKEE
jgi:hypothetical protein